MVVRLALGVDVDVNVVVEGFAVRFEVGVDVGIKDELALGINVSLKHGLEV